MPKTYATDGANYLCNEACELSNWCRKKINKLDTDKLTKKWNRVFMDVCQYIGIDMFSAAILFDTLVLGNWEHIHKTEEEETYTREKWIDLFAGDVFYCSDRWSLDRLTRCHWMYRQIIETPQDKD